MRFAVAVLALGLTACSTGNLSVRQVPELVLSREQGLGDVRFEQAQTALPRRCSDGRPILSGWARHKDVAQVSDATSYIPAAADMDNLYAARDANGRIIRRLAREAQERAGTIKAILHAARSGNWCGGPK